MGPGESGDGAWVHVLTLSLSVIYPLHPLLSPACGLVKVRTCDQTFLPL